MITLRFSVAEIALFGLDLAPPPEVTKAKEARLKAGLARQGFTAAGTATLLKTFLPFIPAPVTDQVAKKISSVAKRIVQTSVDTSSAYATPLGVPCNPNESRRICHERRTTTTTTPSPGLGSEQKRSKRRQQQPGRAPMSHSTTEYDSPPSHALEESLAARHAMEAFGRSAEMETGLKQEAVERDLLRNATRTRPYLEEDQLLGLVPRRVRYSIQENGPSPPPVALLIPPRPAPPLDFSIR